MNKISYLAHNWLVLKINNMAFERNHQHIKGRVVDLGAGSCQYKKDILSVADEYVGVDWKRSIHDQSQVDIWADLTDRLPFDNDYADTVTSFQVMEHLPEPAFFLAEIRRILRPQGCLLLTTPFMWHVHETPHDYFRYTEHGLKSLLSKAGFRNIEITPNSGFWSMMALKANYHSLRYLNGPNTLRYMARLLCIPLWFFDQNIARLLDKIDLNPSETVSYTSVAFK